MLTQPMADEIRNLRTSKVRPADIAALVGVSVRTVQSVLAGETLGRALSPREQFEADASSGWAALCMDATEWAEWRARASFTGTFSEQAARPCTDCPLGFAADMRAQGKCNGTPGGVQHDEDLEEVDQEDNVVEIRAVPITAAPPPLAAPKAIPAPSPARRRLDLAPAVAPAADLVIPCGACLHLPVCGLKASLRVGPGAPAAVTTGFPDGIRMFVTAFRVECDHFLGEVPTRVHGTKPPHHSSERRDDVETRGRHALEALARHNGDKRAAAAELGLRANAFAMVLKHARARQQPVEAVPA